MKNEGKNPVGISTTNALVIGYRRPEALSRCLRSLQSLSLGAIWVWIDGPKDDSEVAKVRRSAQVAEGILTGGRDQLKVNARNFGVRNSVVGALNWFFATNDRGLIFEDDLEPSAEFVFLAQRALGMGPRIGDRGLVSISGSCLVPRERQTNPCELRRSAYFSSWGWASWASQWDLLSRDLRPWAVYKRSISESISLAPGALARLREMHEAVVSGKLNSWAYVTFLECLRLGLDTMATPTNVVVNHGFGKEASHSVRTPDWARMATTMDSLPPSVLTNPAQSLEAAIKDKRADKYLAQVVYGLRAPWDPRRLMASVKRRRLL